MTSFMVACGPSRSRIWICDATYARSGSAPRPRLRGPHGTCSTTSRRVADCGLPIHVMLIWDQTVPRRLDLSRRFRSPRVCAGLQQDEPFALGVCDVDV